MTRARLPETVDLPSPGALEVALATGDTDLELRALMGTLPALLGILRLVLLVRRRRIRVIHTSDRPRDAFVAVVLGLIGAALAVAPDDEIPDALVAFAPDLVIVSPGYHPDHALLVWARERGVRAGVPASSATCANTDSRPTNAPSSAV